MNWDRETLLAMPFILLLMALFAAWQMPYALDDQSTELQIIARQGKQQQPVAVEPTRPETARA